MKRRQLICYDSPYLLYIFSALVAAVEAFRSSGYFGHHRVLSSDPICCSKYSLAGASDAHISQVGVIEFYQSYQDHQEDAFYSKVTLCALQWYLGGDVLAFVQISPPSFSSFLFLAWTSHSIR